MNFCIFDSKHCFLMDSSFSLLFDDVGQQTRFEYKRFFFIGNWFIRKQYSAAQKVKKVQ